LQTRQMRCSNCESVVLAAPFADRLGRRFPTTSDRSEKNFYVSAYILVKLTNIEADISIIVRMKALTFVPFSNMILGNFVPFSNVSAYIFDIWKRLHVSAYIFLI
jgi:hypothetical protein